MGATLCLKVYSSVKSGNKHIHAAWTRLSEAIILRIHAYFFVCSWMFIVLRQAVVVIILMFLITHMQLKLVLGYWSLGVFSLVLAGSWLTRFQWLTGKCPKDGRINLLKASCFLPYYAAVLILMIGGKAISSFRRWQSYSEIYDGIYVGDYYSSFVQNIAWGSIIDVTNELPRFGHCREYLNIQSWDGCPPSVDNIQKAVVFAKTAPRPLLIHCAHGKGRSATVATALLRAIGPFSSIESAIECIKKSRPQTRVNIRMRKVLKAWEDRFVNNKH